MTWKILNWVICTVGFWLGISMVLKAPRKREFLTAVFLGGPVLTAVQQIVGIKIFGWWHFTFTYLSAWGIPVGIIIAWTVAVMLFVYFLPQRIVWQALYICFFSLITVLVNSFFVEEKFMVFDGWNLYYTFLLALISHTLIVYVIMPMSGIRVSSKTMF